MKSIDAEGIPESVAQAVAQLVEAIRAELQAGGQSASRVDLPTRPGSVIGGITREEIYEEHLDHKFPPMPEQAEDEENEAPR